MLNRQLIKGISLVAAITIVFLSLVVTLLLEVSTVMGQVVGPDLTFGRNEWALLVTELRARDQTTIFTLILLAVLIWAYSIIDAYLVGRHFKPADESGQIQEDNAAITD